MTAPRAPWAAATKIMRVSTRPAIPRAGRQRWRCEHDNLHAEERPACGCVSPWVRMTLTDDADLRACRAMRGMKEARRRPGRVPTIDHLGIRMASGSCATIAAAFHCSPALVHRIRRTG